MRIERLFRGAFVLLLAASLIFSPDLEAAAAALDIAVPETLFLTSTYAKLAGLGLELREAWLAIFAIFEKS